MTKLSYIEQAERWFGDASSESSAQIMATLAIAEALQAQTEQMKRIADALENLSGAYTTATFGQVPRRANDDESLSEFQAEKKQAQEWAAGVRRGMGLDE